MKRLANDQTRYTSNSAAVARTSAGATQRSRAGVASLSLLLIAAALSHGMLHAQEAERSASEPKPLSVVKGKEFTISRWADGVYFATGGAGSQECIVVGPRNVLLFDSGTTPGGARALLEDLKLVTDKPVTRVVNSHYHYDHVGGNTAFGPDVEIIGHVYVKEAINTLDPTHHEPYLSYSHGSEGRMKMLQSQLASETDETRKQQLQAQINNVERDKERAKEIHFLAPSVTFDSKLIFDDADHEVQLMYLGRGHTGGDTVLYLPKERIACSGDLVEGGLPYLGSGYFDGWVQTLERLKALDLALVLPGHGGPFTDKAHITHLQQYLTDLVQQVAKLRAQGVTPEQAVKMLDMSSHEKDWGPRMRPVDIRGMRRLYEYLQERDTANHSPAANTH